MDTTITIPMAPVETVATEIVESKSIQPQPVTQSGTSTDGVSLTLKITDTATPNIVTATKKMPNITKDWR